jgi:uncharacterized membrane protein
MNQTTTTTRYPSLDLVRGLAIVLMLIYHFCFGLAQLGIIEAKFSSDPFWISFRSLIIFLFLSLVGIGLFLSSRKNLINVAYFKRLALLLIYAMSITWFSYLVRPNHFVYFGILHLIFISSLLGILLTRLVTINLILALAFLAIGVIYKQSLFDTSAMHWSGLSSHRYNADDFTPIFPWFGLVCLGIYLGHLIFESSKFEWFMRWQPTHWIAKIICWSGRYSIHIYFIHFQFFYVLVLLFG